MVVSRRAAGVLERLGLEDERHGRIGLHGRHDEAGEQAGDRRGEHGVAKQRS